MPPHPQSAQNALARNKNSIAWEAPEYHYREKSVDWYWAVALIALSLAVSAVIFDNILFAVLIVIGTFTLLMHAVRKPRVIPFAATERGIHAGDTRYPYSELHSFWISDDDNSERKLIVQSKKTLSPFIIFPLGESVPEDKLRELLLLRLPEEEHHEPASHRIMEVLGF